MVKLWVIAVLGGLAILLAGCGSPMRTAVFTVPGERYDEAFIAAREELRELGFELDRIDARAGVITTRPEQSAGLLTPWDRDQRRLYDELEDTSNRQDRLAVVAFGAPGTGVDEPVLVDGVAPTEVPVRITVWIERTHRPGWRLETEAPGQSSRAVEVQTRDQSLPGSYRVARRRDPALSAWLADRIEQHLAEPETPSSADRD